MKRTFVIGVAAVVFVALAIRLTFYTVRFNEAAVVTTLGQAGEKAVKTKPGLDLKWPILQSVTKYDTRARFLETPKQVVQTADESQVLVTAFMTWRVTDPLKFYQSFGASDSREINHYRAASEQLTRRLQAAMSRISAYRLDQLLSRDDASATLTQVEEELRAAVSASSGEGSLDSLGMEAMLVGIGGLEFPSDTSREVFKRMNAERMGKAEVETSRGESTAKGITVSATSEARIIEEFARQRAAAIVSQGQKEAAVYLAKMVEGENSAERTKLALFLESVEMLRQVAGSNITLVVPTSNPVLRLLDPGISAEIDAGRNPIEELYRSIRAQVATADDAPATDAGEGEGGVQ